MIFEQPGHGNQSLELCYQYDATDTTTRPARRVMVVHVSAPVPPPDQPAIPEEKVEAPREADPQFVPARPAACPQPRVGLLRHVLLSLGCFWAGFL